MYVEKSIIAEAAWSLGPEFQSVLEAYAGKPKEFIRCEEYLSHIVDELNYESNQKLNGELLTYNKQVTKDYIWNKKLEYELTKFFKVKQINIWWSTGMDPNAYTKKPVSFMILSNKNKYLKNLASDAVIDICIYEECVTVAGLNAQELMAVILHEIGHNFYFCPIYAGLEVFVAIITLPITIVNKIKSLILFNGKLIGMDILKQSIPIVFNMIQSFNRVVSELGEFIFPINIIKRLIQTISEPTNPIMYFANILRYGDENGADSLCAKYGYAADQATALNKMDNPRNTVYAKLEEKDNTGLFGFAHDLAQLSFDAIYLISGDPHPNSNQRAANMLKKLKKDLSTGDYPKDMKKDLEQQINHMEDVLEVCSENNSHSSLQIRRDWYNILNYVFDDNSDFRQLFSFYFDSFRF